MGAGYAFTCSNCNYKVNTSGAWEFYRDDEGKIMHYGHPCPVSGAARKAGIWGLLAQVYCPGCRETKEVILEEYIKPVKESFLVWSRRVELRPEYHHAPTCPDCNNPVYLGNLEGITCPMCQKGSFAGGMEWIS